MIEASMTESEDTVYYWSNTTLVMMDKVTGAAKVLDTSKARFQAQGFVTNANWSWTPNKLLYLAANGAMTQTRPTSGPITILGIAYSATTICFNPQPPKGA